MNDSSPKILVVDDNYAMRAYLAKLLTSYGYNVVQEGRPEFVIKTVRAEKPDLITMDLKMPEVSGEMIIRAMKSAKINIPIVVISAYLNKKNIRTLSDLDIKFIVMKPIEKKRLKTVLHEALKGWSQNLNKKNANKSS